jgi:hypothetical protein
LKAVIVKVLSPGIFLTVGSLAILTSLYNPFVVPSFINMAYPVILHPPLLVGGVHYMVIEVSVELIQKGAENPLGALQAVKI